MCAVFFRVGHCMNGGSLSVLIFFGVAFSFWAASLSMGWTLALFCVSTATMVALWAPLQRCSFSCCRLWLVCSLVLPLLCIFIHQVPGVGDYTMCWLILAAVVSPACRPCRNISTRCAAHWVLTQVLQLRCWYIWLLCTVYGGRCTHRPEPPSQAVSYPACSCVAMHERLCAVVQGAKKHSTQSLKVPRS